MAAEVGYWKMLKEYSVWRVLCGFDLLFSVALTVVLYLLFWECDILLIDKELFSNLMGVSSGLFGILFAAFAIIISLSDEKFVSILKKAGVYNNLIFPFWHVSLIYLISIFIDFIIILTIDKSLDGNHLPVKSSNYRWLIFIGIFFSIYSLASTFFRIAATVKFGVYRSKFVSSSDENAEKKKK